MATVAERFLEAVEQHPGETDRFYTNLLFGKSRYPSHVNQEARLLVNRGLVVRKRRDDGRFGTYPTRPSSDPMNGGNGTQAALAMIDPRLLPFLEALSELLAKAVFRELDPARRSGSI
jgi:hypothetical protein